MAYPIRTCVICSEEFELKPDKPGFANRCPECSAQDEDGPSAKHAAEGFRPTSEKDMNDARKQAMRDLLYRKDA